MSTAMIKAIAILLMAIASCSIAYLFLLVERNIHGHEHALFTNAILTLIAAGFIRFTVITIRAKPNSK